jgi:hypothetical protein
MMILAAVLVATMAVPSDGVERTCRVDEHRGRLRQRPVHRWGCEWSKPALTYSWLRAAVRIQSRCDGTVDASQALVGASSLMRVSTRRLISSLMGRTASTPLPAGSSSTCGGGGQVDAAFGAGPYSVGEQDELPV